MKYTFSLLALCVCLSVSQAAEKTQEIKAPVTGVKVCLNAAHITHTQTVNVKPGMNRLAFMGLASTIVSRHISLRNTGSGEILELMLYTITDTTDILALPADLRDVFGRSRDSVVMLEKNISKLTHELRGLELERQMLLTNTDVIPNGKLVTAAEMKITLDFYRDRYRDVNLEIQNKNRDLSKLKKQKVRVLKSAFSNDSDNEGNVNFNIIVAVINNTGAAYTTDMQLNYVAMGAGWIPVYDIYATGNKSLQIQYRARVLNNTGIDWENQKVTLSTADLTAYYEAPGLQPMYINRYSRNRSSSYSSRYKDDYNYNNEEQKNTLRQPAGTEEIYTPDKEINFTLQKNYTFHAGRVPLHVDVTTYDLTPEFFYRCAPKNEAQAYAIARIKDWEKLNLLDGEASIYNDMVFLGKSYIRPSDIEEYLELPLGVMDKIYIKHKLLSEYSSKRVLAGEVVATQSYEIKIKNTGTEKINIEVLDQVPVSEEKSVKTNISEITDGNEQDALTGEILWRLEINGGSEKTLVLKYSVTYPKRSGYSLNQGYKKRQVRAMF